MTAPLLAVDALEKSFGGVRATQHVSFAVDAGTIHAVIGPNGAGKTTLLAQIAGDLHADAGTIVFRGAEITRLGTPERVRRGIARSFQIATLFDDLSAEENVALALQARHGGNFRWWEPAASDRALRDQARGLLERVGLGARAAASAGTLAHGERGALDIAIALGAEPELLLLDEPMAGMGSEESQAMVALLRSLRGTHALLLVEHDLEAVFALADRITVLDDGRTIASGTPDEIRADPEVQRAYLGAGLL